MGWQGRRIASLNLDLAPAMRKGFARIIEVLANKGADIPYLIRNEDEGGGYQCQEQPHAPQI